jgi:hypothetical protein
MSRITSASCDDSYLVKQTLSDCIENNDHFTLENSLSMKNTQDIPWVRIVAEARPVLASILLPFARGY